MLAAGVLGETSSSSRMTSKGNLEAGLEREGSNSIVLKQMGESFSINFNRAGMGSFIDAAVQEGVGQLLRQYVRQFKTPPPVSIQNLHTLTPIVCSILSHFTLHTSTHAIGYEDDVLTRGG